MVKTFDNYGFARDAWSFLVAPAWYHGVVRVGSLSAVWADAGGGGGGNRARSVPPQQMSAPVRPGAFVYAQEVGATRRGRKRDRERRERLRRIIAADMKHSQAVAPLYVVGAMCWAQGHAWVWMCSFTGADSSFVAKNTPHRDFGGD